MARTPKFSIRTPIVGIAGHYIVSTVELPIGQNRGDFETLVFEADAQGKVTNWAEVDGRRYDTEQQAIVGHEEFVTKWEV